MYKHFRCSLAITVAIPHLSPLPDGHQALFPGRLALQMQFAISEATMIGLVSAASPERGGCPDSNTVDAARLDGAFHLAAVPEARGQPASYSCEMLVPTAIGAYKPNSTASQPANALLISARVVVADGQHGPAVRCSITIEHPAAGSACSVQEMFARRLSPATAPEPSAESARRPAVRKLEELLYEVQWQADAGKLPASQGLSNAKHMGSVEMTSSLIETQLACSGIAAGQAIAAGSSVSHAVVLNTTGVPHLPSLGRPAVAAVQLGLWGMLRSIGLEVPSLSCTGTAFDPVASKGPRNGAAALSLRAQDAAAAADVYSGASWSAGVLFSPRLLSSQRTAVDPIEQLNCGIKVHRRTLASFCIAAQPADLESLIAADGGCLVPQAINPVTSCTKALVEVRAVGLNFRDVLNILGLYPGDAGAPGVSFALAQHYGIVLLSAQRTMPIWQLQAHISHAACHGC